ncbi:hypothetical protein OAH16_00790 [bacterium]|nr:hypothetical protein [bacterium]
MKNCSIEEYNRKEDKAILVLPNRIIEAFHPIIFQQLGWPFLIRHERELFRYVEGMHEERFDEFSEFLDNRLTIREFDMLQRLTGLMCDFTESRFHEMDFARSSVLASLNVFRHIGYLSGNQPLRVFEFGPGSGYLGAMLILEGYPYASTDITQALYLYQNHSWNFFSDGKVTEGVTQEIDPGILASIPGGSVVHVPWWEFVQLRPDEVPAFDIVTCNHALTEMHPDSLRFCLLMSRALLKRSDSSLPAFVFEGWGYATPDDIERTCKTFQEFGFSMIHSDWLITIFVPKVANNSVQSPERIKAVPAIREGRLVGYQAAYESSASPYHSQNPLSRAILSGREGFEETGMVPMDQLKVLYTALLGREDLDGPYERFAKLVNPQPA